ncbi:MAG: hypothetical protein HYY85_10580, partial [Deltaproteobacteria bacterium]|nr:hypothetical protein [Deltaproteobacteria bacterium]
MMITRRIVLGIALAVGLIGWSPSPGVAADKVSFALDWLFYGKHAGFFAAQEKG